MTGPLTTNLLNRINTMLKNRHHHLLDTQTMLASANDRADKAAKKSLTLNVSTNKIQYTDFK